MYSWNPVPPPAGKKLSVVGAKRLFHSQGSRCIKGTIESGDKPPKGFWPCYRCFPTGGGQARALRDVS